MLLSKILQKPIKVLWSREDDVKNDKFRPATVQRLEAALDGHGKIVGWRDYFDNKTWFKNGGPSLHV